MGKCPFATTFPQDCHQPLTERIYCSHCGLPLATIQRCGNIEPVKEERSMDDLGQKLNQIRTLLRFRYRQIGITAFLVSGIVSAIIWYLPDQFSATTTILVDPQKNPEKYVSSTVSEDPGARLNTITQE